MHTVVATRTLAKQRSTGLKAARSLKYVYNYTLATFHIGFHLIS